MRFVVILDFIRDIDGVTARRARRETNMHSFHGTFIRNCIVTHVIDGKTICVLLNPDGGQQRSSTGDGWEDSLVVGSEPTSRIPSDELDASSVDPTTWEKVDVRLIYVDTEESLEVKKEEQAYKPITPAGVEAFDWLKKRLGSAADGRCGDVEVDIEFDTCEFMTSVSRAREYSLDKYGRVLAYVYHNGNSVNVETVLAGQSPYFTKHGRSRLYHGEFALAEKLAIENIRGIWDPAGASLASFGMLEYSRDYRRLLPWWRERELFIEDWRHWGHLGLTKDILNPRDARDYQKLLVAAAAREKATILVDLQPTQSNLYDGVMQLIRYEGGKQGLCIFAGTRRYPFNLWMDDANSMESGRLQALLHARYCQNARNFCFITGSLFIFHAKNRPQMLLESCEQVSDFPLRPDDMSQKLREHHRAGAAKSSPAA